MTTTSANPLTSARATIRTADPVIHLDGEPVQVVRQAPAPSHKRVTPEDETRVVSALRAAASADQLPGNPPEGYGRALARALTVDPAVAADRLTAGIYPSHSDTADLATITATLGTFTVLPGPQPRGASKGGREGQVPEPSTGTDDAAAALGLTVLEFDSPSHLRAWCADALVRSLPGALDRGRRHEVGSTGVRRPVSASMTLVQFRDGTSAQWVPMVGDGISRLAVCATTLLGLEDCSTAEAVRRVVDHMIPHGALTSGSRSHELARRMRKKHDSVLADYEQHVLDGIADEHAVRLRQFLNLPVSMHLMASDPDTSAACSMELAIEGIVSDQHTGIDGWEDADDARHTARRALARMAREGTLDDDLLALCLNRAELPRSPLLRSPDQVDEPPAEVADSSCGMDRLLLRRAVAIQAALLSPGKYTLLKTALRGVSGRKKLQLQHVVDFLAPLVCEPWGASRPVAGAWGYGGPVPSWILDVDFAPTHPEDYLDLVSGALDTSSSHHEVQTARLELALAGGTALIANGVLTTALVGGSGGRAESLPFRGPINAAVDALTCTEEGLTALALAANGFKPSRPSRVAPLPGVDLDREDKVLRDGVGVATPITERVLANVAARAISATQTPVESDRREPTPLETLQLRARCLPDEAQAMLRSVELTKRLYEETGGPTGLNEPDVVAAYEALSKAAGIVGWLR